MFEGAESCSAAPAVGTGQAEKSGKLGGSGRSGRRWQQRPRSSQGICHYFASGRGCRYGSRCQYLHQVSKIKSSSENQDPTKSTINSEGQTVSQQVEYTPDVQDLRMPVENTSQNPRKRNVSESSSTATVTSTETSGSGRNKGASGRTASVCYFYSRTKRCRFGEKCRYAHVDVQHKKPVHGKETKPSVESTESPAATQMAEENLQVEGSLKQRDSQESGDPQSKPEAKGPKVKPQYSRKMCYYFRLGQCNFGDRCRYWHPCDVLQDAGQSNVSQERDTTSDVGQQTSLKGSEVQNGNKGNVREKAQHRPRMFRPAFRKPAQTRPTILLEKLTEEEQVKLRATEIGQLKKRFPNVEVIRTDMKDGTKTDKFKIQFVPSDPDWPYDVKQTDLLVNFPKDYPKVAMEVSLPEEQRLPETVRKSVQRQIEHWIKRKFDSLAKAGKTELAFRPFLRWLDKNLQDVFTEGLHLYKRELIAKAAGIEFITADELKEKYAGGDEAGPGTGDSDEDAQISAEENEKENSDPSEDGDQAKRDHVPKAGTMSMLDPSKRGTEIKLHNLQLLESTATLLGTKLSLIVQCERCKNKTELTTPADRLNLVNCAKCNSEQLISYRANLIHQFTSVLGYLDLQGCIAFDLVLSESDFKVTCLACSKEMVVKGIPPGQPKDTWCLNCHQKMRVAIETVRFLQLQPSTLLDTKHAHNVVVQKQRRVLKDPAIQEGKPLPDRGACKHFKKSFRWLRFPCCGKTYPCDHCHDENELDHEMKYANRMICGFCAKEQPYAGDKACVSCQSFMTKKSSAHWEGGLGCRDKVKMSKTDSQKYSSIRKTTSKKSQAKTNPAKKTTKLRHT